MTPDSGALTSSYLAGPESSRQRLPSGGRHGSLSTSKRFPEAMAALSPRGPPSRRGPAKAKPSLHRPTRWAIPYFGPAAAMGVPVGTIGALRIGAMGGAAPGQAGVAAGGAMGGAGRGAIGGFITFFSADLFALPD